ncbi:Focadhesin [Auxenochlorella protothecoides]|uniref:Focadhesin n=1 Tax=Auxenochlorella protothecoides TaxID=3075 RepID=A0A087SJA6_AUXPR|nr:Focadhesin [Auxenochlorella protothecoides]KFM25810.1 Focadhesin [Auxenochlorella protothecoides]
MQPVTSATTSSHSNAATHVTQIDPWIRQDAAAVAVQRLVQLATAGRVSRGAAQDLLLAAASGAPVPHLPALLNGLVGLIVAHPPPGPVAWPRHPLCRALHVGPSAADAAVQAAVRALWGGRGGATLQRTLRALRPVLCAALHVVGWGAGAPASQALALAFLAGTAGTACAPGLLALLGRFLGDDQEAAARPDRAAALLIAFPLVHLASLAADAGARAWAAGVLKRVAGLQCPLLPVTESLNPNAHPKAQPACRSIPAPRPWARYAVALEALRALWRGSREATRGWLVALRTHAGACGQSPSSLPVGMLCALLRHLDVETCEEALRTLAALAGPGAGGTAVVLLAQLLRALREETRAGPAMAMLRQLPALGKHTEALPFVLLSLQRLFHPGSDPRLRELGFELMEAAWKANRRAYPALQTCLLGATRASASGNPGPQPSVAQLRAVCSICAQDPNKGVEFLGSIQAGLSSTGADALQALALRCVRQLCAADVLEFYSAWRAVVLDLMAHGALDAAAEPEVVGGILDALWLATQHRSAAVRLAAFLSLAAYDYSLLEESEEAPDVPDLLALLVCEEDEACLDAAGKLLGAALVFNYSRLQGTGKASVGAQDASPLEDSLIAMSKSMLDGGSQAAPALLRRLPSLSPVRCGASVCVVSGRRCLG